MKKFGMLLLLLAIGAVGRAAEEYTLGPDSQRQPNVPRGTVTQYTWTSKIFPGTVRDYWIYVPAQYTAAKPACVMVFQDGAAFIKENGDSRIPIVFDNLINRNEMPVTIGVFINPGVVPASSPDQLARYNRSFEYDSLGDRYVTFLLTEILPEIAKHYNLSKDPNDRAIAGMSSGGICSFTAAWERPDAFHRVLSFIGSFTDIRGGDVYPALIRKTEPKRLRVFLQDGAHDNNTWPGDWFLANQSIVSALEWAGYDAKFVTGTMNHDMKQGGAIMPDALRWLWRDYPQPIAKPRMNRDTRFLPPMLDPDSEWELVENNADFENAGLAVDSHGSVYAASSEKNRIITVGEGATGIAPKAGSHASAMKFGADGRLYACQNRERRVVVYSPGGKESVLAENIGCADMVVTHSGNVYVTDPLASTLWLINPTGQKREVYRDARLSSGIGLSPDQSQLYVTHGDVIWSFRINADGSLANGEPFYHLEGSSAGYAMDVDNLGYLYVATGTSVQICDQPGRVVALTSNPGSGGSPYSLVIGGPDLDFLYVISDGKLFRRHILRKGVPAGTPIKPPVPRL
jgi:enterochelin esterase-like enzyme/sugar lactone lactonase YvrE